MLGRKNRRAPVTKGRGVAAAKQMGLFTDLSPEAMMDMEGNFDDPDLEAEFAAIVGNKTAGAGKPRPKPKAPLPMEHIEKMAEECMKDSGDDEEDEDLENDEDLLAELQEVVGEEDTVTEETSTLATAETLESAPQPPDKEVKISAATGSLQHMLEERIQMYKTATANAKSSGESSKARRYDRGLKTLETMLGSVKKGLKIEEADIPPPVAVHAPPAPKPTPPEQAPSISPEAGPCEKELIPSTDAPVQSCQALEQEQGSTDTQTAEANTGGAQEDNKAKLLKLQREYRVAAVKAKQVGNIEQAKDLLKTGKRIDAMIEALDNGQPVDLSSLPPLPGAPEMPGSGSQLAVKKEENTKMTKEGAAPASSVPSNLTQPKNILEALEQRMAKYQEAYTQAKDGGDARKARMHERIAKQYQSAIRAHKAGKPVNFEELPVPPGFPPIPGLEKAEAEVEPGLAAVLEAANKLANDAGKESAEDEDEEETKPPAPQKPKKPTLAVAPSVPIPKMAPSPSQESHTSGADISPKAQEQLDLLESRKKQYMKAALQAKQNKDLEQARNFLRTAKGLQPMIEAARSGQVVDITKVPSPPGDEDEDFILVHHSEVQTSEKTEEVYSQLSKLLKEQYEKCMTYSKQFTHLGNIAETTKFEKMSESCKKNLEILKLSQAQGLEPPKHHFEERTFKTVRIFPEISSTEMVVVIVKGMNLPAPHGTSANDLDAFVKFEFPYPSTEQPQKHKTTVVKNTNCPEYNQSFTLTINRGHRGFRRVIQSKGLKLEVLHKGGFLRSDKPIGTAHLKLEKLETESEVREIVEVIEGRKPTGGLLEVRVRLREPLGGQDVQTTTQRWLILDQPQVVL